MMRKVLVAFALKEEFAPGGAGIASARFQFHSAPFL
jgi:hypothetical protein